MKVGITYDLRDDYLKEGFSEEETAEFDRASTIEAIEGALAKLGYNTDRIGHARSLCTRLTKGERWDIVFNIAEGLDGIGREAQVPAILDLYKIPYTFSDPLVMSLTLHKAIAKRVARDLGVPTPEFALVENVSDIERVNIHYPLFVKPVAEGTGKGITGASKVNSRAELKDVCINILDKYRQAALVEAFLPGRELTVSLVGSGRDATVVGSLEVELLKDAEEHAYSYVNKERCEELIRYTLVRDDGAHEAEAMALDIWRGMGCRDAGRIDFRADASGRMSFMEVNPLAGIHPEHSDLPIACSQAGIPYRDLIEMIMCSALARVHASPHDTHRTRLRELQKKHGLRGKDDT